MAERRRAAANRIRGPQSALTDFLASHNISAQQIHQDYQRRIREVEEQGQAEAGPSNAAEEPEQNDVSDSSEAPEERKKRKRKEQKAIQKIKQSKEFAKKKKFNEDNEDFEDDDDIAASMMYTKQKKLPGQLANCEECGKRFTVTAYSKNGPEGGLLCTKCSKELALEEKRAKPAKPRGAPRGKRRQTESNRLDGFVHVGPRSLLEHCVLKVAQNIDDVEELGDLPQTLLDRLSQILSKRRVLTSNTLNLFLKREMDKIDIYDSGKLETEDFQKIFAFMPDLEKVNLRFAGQMKDPVIDYMVDHNPNIKHLQLGAANLVSDDGWRKLFEKQGAKLESLKLSELNDSLGDASVESLVRNCPNVTQLKLKKCTHMTEASLESLANLTRLERLSLNVAHDSSAETLVTLIRNLGPNLRTLSLEHIHEANDDVLASIHNSCSKLSKLRLTDNSIFSDGAFTSLFDSWDNPPIQFIDLSDNRDIDNQNPDGPIDSPIGLASDGFRALMAHSGSKIERLNVSSCRHIDFDALSDVFDGKKRYPMLRDIDLSFVNNVDDFVVGGIFRSCPALTKLAVFACFKVRDVRIPKGIAVVGMPNAQDKIVTEGDFMGDIELS